MNLVDHYTAMFVDVSKQRFARAWKFFLLGEKEDLGKAQCQLCKKHLKFETPKTSRPGNRFHNSRKDFDEKAGTSRSQSSRGSMFQAPQASNSVFTFRSRTEDANQTIFADPAIKKRGPVKDRLKDCWFEIVGVGLEVEVWGWMGFGRRLGSRI